MEYDATEILEMEELTCPCGSTSHVIDHTSHDRICVECGVVSIPELETYEGHYQPDRRDSRRSHFATAIYKVDMKGQVLNTTRMENLRIRFDAAVRSFLATRHIHKRKNMLSYHFVLWKLLEEDGYKESDLPFRLKLPKMVATRARLEETWYIMVAHRQRAEGQLPEMEGEW